MGVYIKGMEMPKNCGYCPIRHLGGDGDECFLGAKITEYQTRPEDCPLIPVPPHGRLIDADALIAAHEQVCSLSMKFNLDLAPTIIEAEEGE